MSRTNSLDEQFSSLEFASATKEFHLLEVCNNIIHIELPDTPEINNKNFDIECYAHTSGKNHDDKFEINYNTISIDSNDEHLINQNKNFEVDSHEISKKNESNIYQNIEFFENFSEKIQTIEEIIYRRCSESIAKLLIPYFDLYIINDHKKAFMERITSEISKSKAKCILRVPDKFVNSISERLQEEKIGCEVVASDDSEIVLELDDALIASRFSYWTDLFEELVKR